VIMKSEVDVCGSIFHPAVREDSASPVILYLPSGPHADETWNVYDEKIIAALSAASNGTIVRVNYRLGDGVRYPTPVHDVLAGYDYVKERFSLPPSTTRNGRIRKAHLRVGVCGQLVGGSLAAVLALTESQLAADRIAAAAFNCPITDWIFPESTSEDIDAIEQDETDEQLEKTIRKRRKKKLQLTSWEAYRNAEGLTTTSLEATRNISFKKPASWFDPFASPVLFLRSAGVDIPRDRPADESDGDGLTPTTNKPRKVHRNFPPSNSSLVLPNVRMSIGEANPLFDQDEEFVKLLRRSVVRSVENRASTQAMLDRFDEAPATKMERLELAVAAAEERVEYHVHAGTGLWGTAKETEWLDQVWRVAGWFRKVLT
jgi:acetyl esterase/lipase